MKVPRPQHATVVAYLALLTALGGTAFAATRDQTGGRELAPFVLREQQAPSTADGSGFARVECRPREQFVAGSGFWDSETGGTTGPSISGGRIGRAGVRGRPRSYSVSGHTPLGPNTLVAQAVCLPN